ncbi:MAG: hypothetical protein RMK64_12180 [Rhodovarius sp.]|nr:hypothetical protein [Rhodovarius sp.]
MITFGSSGNAGQLQLFGFDLSADLDFSWTTAKFCGIDIPLAGDVQECTLEFEYSPWVSGTRVPAQDLFVFINGLFFHFSRAERQEVMSIALPPSVISSRLIQLRLVIPTAVAPRRLGVSADERMLGFFIRQIALS